jgi:hypothetical protein
MRVCLGGSMTVVCVGVPMDDTKLPKLLASEGLQIANSSQGEPFLRLGAHWKW